MKSIRLLLFISILLTSILCGCRMSFDYVEIIGAGGPEPEKAFLESFFLNGIFEESGLRLFSDEIVRENPKIKPSIFIELLSSWDKDAAYGEILVSQKTFVPREDAIAGRTVTSLAACLDGSETLVAPEEIEPPFVALKVDGLAIGDEGYPLVWSAGINIYTDESAKTKKGFEEKFSLLEEFFKNAPKPLIHSVPAPVWISVGGDLMLDRGASDILLREGPAGIFGDTAEMLASSDIALVNFEGVASDRGERVPKSFNFRFDPAVAPALRDAGIDAVLHANNHVFDFGVTAFLDSLANLRQAGIGVAGAGNDDDEASDPAVFTIGGETFRVFGLASFPRERNGWDGVTAAAQPGIPGMLHAGRNGAEKLKEKMSPNDSAVNIILFHGGVEWSTRPDAATRSLYTDLIASGADLVIGSHPHIVQGFEWVLDKPVFWSLGNYVFGGMENTEGGEEGLFIRLGYWQGRLLYLEPFPLILTHTRTDIAPPERLDVFYTRSRQLRE